MGRTAATISPGVDSSPSSSSAESSFRVLDDVFLQTQTRIWLGEVLQTRLDDQLNISDLLADGELLFEVSKIVWTMLLAKCKDLRHVKGYKYNPFGSRKSSGRYRPYSNVDSFLKICKILGLSCIDLFSPSDVVEKRDTRKVCICIRSLSKKVRSKQLKVPDFDIVTHPVTMPTNMVGCLRRSLEMSNSSFTSSANYTPYRDSKLKLRQKNSVVACDRNYDCYSEASDDTANNYTGKSFYRSSTKYYLNDSPGVSSVVKKYSSALSVSQGDNQDQEKHECYGKSDHQLESMSSPSVDSETISRGGASHFDNGGRYRHGMCGPDFSDVDSGGGNDASIVGNSLDEYTEERLSTSHQWELPDLIALGTDNSNPFLFDGEDSMLNLLLAPDSHGSNSTGRASRNGCGRRFSDDFEDVEVSSVTSMSSILGRMLNLDFEDQFDGDDLRTANLNFTDLHNFEADDSLDRSSTGAYEIQDMAEDENSLEGIVSETSHFETKLGKFGFSTQLHSECPNSSQSHTREYQVHVGSSNNEIGVTRINSIEVLQLEGKKYTVSDNAKEVNGVIMAELVPVIGEQQKNCPPVACSSIINESGHEDSNASGNNVLVEGSEPCHWRSNTDDGSGLKDLSICIQDSNSQGTPTSYMFAAADNHTVDCNFVSPANKCQTTSEIHPRESSATVDKKDHGACSDHNENLHDCAEYDNKDESKREIVDNLEELPDGRESTNPRLSPGEPHIRPLLKTVVRGSALFGMLFLLLRLRGRSGREKGGEVSKKSSKIQMANSMEHTSKKEQKGSRVNGIYPADKFKFGN